jgi:hypothetical protein
MFGTDVKYWVPDIMLAYYYNHHFELYFSSYLWCTNAKPEVSKGVVFFLGGRMMKRWLI